MLFKSLLLAGTASATCLSGLSKFKRAEGEEGVVQVGQFGYTGLIGPLNWASIAPENEECKSGTTQSPINVVDGVIPISADKPTIDIPQQAVEFENLGTTVELVINGTTKIADQDLVIKQAHFHFPGEHLVNGEYYPAEMHIVHEARTDPNTIAVISVLFQMSADAASNPLLTGLQPHLQAIANPGTKTAIEGGLDFAGLVQHVQDSPLYQYSGSLTTPPCAGGVTFLIAQNPMDMPVDIYNAMKAIVGFNARYTQADLDMGVNLIEVATKAGTAEQFPAPAGTGNGTEPTPTVEAVAGAPPAVTKGQTIVLSEISGQPTSVLAIIV
ncbi:carbonic anhydrase [Aaosphaeria arxii CBS 175.79]|uniref:carbonic anhydrase n=1 Tax=Aaosphaeria arxii CBS 175.79 TaxID=1450172 RepID=A0A6A5YB13_9PLEO|nr:carbonic anhydrase [Aaosphaeria arxii CBS 175.79]KAF2021784.1 carbonic anhydrase [Aaosphaeria arxii CBS 175.79]